MENRRAYRSGRVLLWDSSERGLSPISALAGLAILVLFGSLVWKTSQTLAGRDVFVQNPGPDNEGGAKNSEFGMMATSSTSNLSYIGDNALNKLISGYVALKQTGTYTEAQGNKVASNAAATVSTSIPYTSIAGSDLQTDPDTSYKRMLTYRTDLRAAFAPLLLTTEPELTTFGRYVESKDKNNLTQLMAAAGRYKAAAKAAAHVVVPSDAITYHVGVVNALLQFGATLEAMVSNADDAMATLALLRSYNTAEQNVLTSFNALAGYETRKTP